MQEYDLSGIELPFDINAEQSVIGALLYNGEIMTELIAELKPDHFYVDLNKRVYEIASNMTMSSQQIDVVTVSEACVRHSVFKTSEEARKYLTDAMAMVPSVSAAPKYAKIIIEKSMLRQLIFAAKEIIDAANNRADPADTIVDYAEQKVFSIRQSAEVGSLTPIRRIIYDRIKNLNELVNESRANGGNAVMSGLETGFRHVDKRIYGLNKSDLIIIAARPGMGKTSFAMNLVTGAAKYNPKLQMCVFSLEMSKEQIVSRMLSSEAQISSDAMKTGKLNEAEISNIMRSCEILQNLEIYVDDTPGMSVAAMKSKLRRMKNLGLVVVDYLQLMTSAGNYSNNRVAEMSEITRSLKIMAKELNVPVIALSQLARGPEQRIDKHPLLSDLRDSGSIEQDADIVLFLYRPSYYDKTDPKQNVCECIIAKNRHGETCTVPIGWQGEYTRFYNVDYTHAEPPH